MGGPFNCCSHAHDSIPIVRGISLRKLRGPYISDCIMSSVVYRSACT